MKIQINQYCAGTDRFEYVGATEHPNAQKAVDWYRGKGFIAYVFSAGGIQIMHRDDAKSALSLAM